MTPELVTAMSDLRAAYAADRVEVERSANPLAEIPSTVCRYCGKYRSWVNCTLDGHAACYVSPAFKQHLHRTLQHRAPLTFAIVGRELGVTMSIIRAWYHQGEKLRGAA